MAEVVDHGEIRRVENNEIGVTVCGKASTYSEETTYTRASVMYCGKMLSLC